MTIRVAAALALACACTPATPTVPVSPTTTPPVAAAPVRFQIDEPWQTQVTVPYRGKQDDVYFVDPTHGFYGNGEGKLYRTADGGTTWTLAKAQPGTFIRALGFLDAQRGFIGNVGVDYFPGVTDPQLLYRTDDGGATWSPVALPDAADARGLCAIDILSVEYINHGELARREVVTVGGRVGGPAAAFRSDDGGGSWRRLTLPDDTAMILDIKFVDTNVGFIFASDNADVEQAHALILRTGDSGRTWAPVYRSTRPFELTWKASFPTKQVGYATLQSYDETAPQRYVLKTTDGGLTWRELPLANDASVKTFGIGFVDEHTGWVGGAPTAYATTDGGATWTPEPGLGVAANKFRIVPDATGADVFAIGVAVNRAHVTPVAPTRPPPEAPADLTDPRSGP